MSLLGILLVLLIASCLFGGFGGTGVYGWSPAGLLVLIIVILVLTGNLHV